MRIVFVYADKFKEWNCSYWNCVVTCDAINEYTEHTSHIISIKDFVKNDLSVYNLLNLSDLIIVERNLFGETLSQMMYWKIKNKNIAVIFDDAYNHTEETNKSYKFWKLSIVEEIDANGRSMEKNIKPIPLDQFLWGLQISKASIMPSKNLVNEWGFATDTYYLPNNPDKNRYIHNIDNPLYPHPKDEIYIGWCGSLSHYESFKSSGVLNALKRISDEYPKVKIFISGDKRVYDSIDIPDNKKVFSGFVQDADWSRLLASLDIAVAPLSGTYDKKRSWLKVFEYTLMKVPWVATNYETYKDLKEFGVMVENGEKNWYNAIKDVVENIENYRKFAEEGYKFALENCIDKKVHDKVAVYKKIIEKDYPKHTKQIDTKIKKLWKLLIFNIKNLLTNKYKNDRIRKTERRLYEKK